ncbi:SEC14 cytosolic factor [Linum perenne]
MEDSSEMALTQMRKSVETLGSTTEKYGDPTLMRFLIARSMDADKAAKMFVQWQKWRDSFVPNGFISDSEVPDELVMKKVFLQGLTKDGYPLVIVMAGKHYPSKDQPQFKSKFCILIFPHLALPSDEAITCLYNPPTFRAEFIVHLLDKTIASAIKGREVGNEKLVALLDMQQLAYKNVDARGLITGFQFLQAYYPERLHKLYILNMPKFFVNVWKLISRFLEKATLDKVMIVTNEEERSEFVSEVGEETLPEEYGGRGKLVAVQDVVLPPLEV